MFKQRLLTTLVLVPLVLLAIYYTNYACFLFISLLLVTGCALEWLQLVPANNLTVKLVFLSAMAIACYLISFAYIEWLMVGMALWIAILACVSQFPRSQSCWGHALIVALAALVLLPLFAHSLAGIFLMSKGRGLVVYVLCLVWAADIGAYLAGKKWGRHKLIPAVSPGKTIEGASGGLLMSMLVALIGFYCFHPRWAGNWFLVSIATALISLLGDLFISMLKRRVNIKDTGHIIPGHGGILDRLDSLIAAAPMFCWGMYFFNPGLGLWF